MQLGSRPSATRRRVARLAALAAAALLVALSPTRAWSQTAPPLAAGDLLVADANNARILLVRPSTGVVQHFSPPPNAFPPPIGSFDQVLDQPAALVASDQGHLFVVDVGLAAIVEIETETGAQSVLLDLGGQPVRASAGIAVDAQGILYAWDQIDGLVRLELRPGNRWRRTIVSDFPRSNPFQVTALALTRDADGQPSEFFLTVRQWAPSSLPGALWRIDAATGAAESIAVTEDVEAIYTDVVARGDCKELACTLTYARCQANAGIFGNMASLEVFGIVGIFPLFGTLYDGFESSRCVFSMASGAVADEQFVATAFGYEDARIERIYDDPVRRDPVADLPRGPFDFAPFPTGTTRVVQPIALPIPVPEAAPASGAAVALAALAALAAAAAGLSPPAARHLLVSMSGV